MPSRTPYEAWVQQEERKRRRTSEIATSIVLLFILAFWAGVIWAVAAII